MGVLATEKEIASAMVQSEKHLSCVVEGAAAMTMACFIKERNKYVGQKIVVVCCGGNVGIEAMEQARQLVC